MLVVITKEARQWCSREAGPSEACIMELDLLLRVLGDNDGKLARWHFFHCGTRLQCVSEVRQKTFKKTRWPNINSSEKTP
jgi:hypothetical protein